MSSLGKRPIHIKGKCTYHVLINHRHTDVQMPIFFISICDAAIIIIATILSMSTLSHSPSILIYSLRALGGDGAPRLAWCPWGPPLLAPWHTASLIWLFYTGEYSSPVVSFPNMLSRPVLDCKINCRDARYCGAIPSASLARLSVVCFLHWQLCTRTARAS